MLEHLDYIASQEPEHQYQLKKGFLALLEHCTPAFRQQFEAPFVLTMPIEAEDESDTISNTLQQFAEQSDPPPYRLLAYLNFSSEATNDPQRLRAVAQTNTHIHQFMQDNPNVPLGLVTQTVEDPTIGMLRKYVNDLALLNSPRDTLLLTQDADLVKMHPLFLRRMWQAHTDVKLPRGFVLASRVRHARSHELPDCPPLPNMDSVVAWLDLKTRLAKFSYELGTAVTAEDYTDANGFDPDLIAGEVINLIWQLRARFATAPRNWYIVPGAQQITSPRRIYHKLYQQKILYQFWGDDDMHLHDYRTFALKDLVDISAVERDVQIGHIETRQLHGHLRGIAYTLAARGIVATFEALSPRYEYARRIGHAVLGSRPLYDPNLNGK